MKKFMASLEYFSNIKSILFFVTRKAFLPYFLVLLFVPMVVLSQESNSSDEEIINLFNKIDTEPISISFQNSLVINNKGGHIQGIQYFDYQDNDFYFLSGSSDSYSYYSVIKMGNRNSVISINKILDKPFKHAGGFQIYNNIMAIGVEDNMDKDKSKIFIYKLDNPESLPKKPLKIINRSGVSKRATAGCVGVIEIDDNILVVVGDWDTKHLDFYKIKKEELYKNEASFKLEYTVDTEKADKSKWIDKSLLPYQNINFIKDSFGKLYLAGMTTNHLDENVIDLFRVEIDDKINYKLKKVFTRKFKKNKEASFRWGAGIYLSDDNKLKILSSGSHIEKKSNFLDYE